jgi:hypothetical protein
MRGEVLLWLHILICRNIYCTNARIVVNNSADVGKLTMRIVDYFNSVKDVGLWRVTMDL